MSFAVDANVLLYASDIDNPHHERAAALLAAWTAGREVFYLPWPVIMAYLRISTHSGVFSSPLTCEEASSNVEALLALPHARTIGEGADFWKCFRDSTRALAVRGNLMPDAHIVALMLENGLREIVTNDADFKKFDGVTVRNPFA